MRIPKIGDLAESLIHECKAKYTNPDTVATQLEIAKDISALANSVGGKIFIGVSEDRSTRLVAGYVPTTDPERATVIGCVEEAVRRYLRPRPLVTIDVSTVDEHSVVVVEVRPFPGMPVGVLVPIEKTAAAAQDNGEPAYRFPFRMATQTIYLSPDQLGVIMESKSRRMAALLSNIQEEDRNDVRVCIANIWSAHSLIEVDLLANSFTLKAKSAARLQGPPSPIARSLDAIETVHQAAKGVWSIKLRDGFT